MATAERAQAQSSTDALADAISEKDFQQTVIDVAHLNGWKVFHPYDSRRSEPGWPDLCLVRGAVCIFLELKSEKGHETLAQKEWIRALKQVNIIEADFAYPRHLEQIIDMLSSRAR